MIVELFLSLGQVLGVVGMLYAAVLGFYFNPKAALLGLVIFFIVTHFMKADRRASMYPVNRVLALLLVSAYGIAVLCIGIVYTNQLLIWEDYKFVINLLLGLAIAMQAIIAFIVGVQES